MEYKLEVDPLHNLHGAGLLKEPMNQIQMANILLTRRCNLRCDYCCIVRDYDSMPAAYPAIEHYHKHELLVADWISIISKLAKNNPDIFLIFYGGEPFLYDGLIDLISHCKKMGRNYTIISNNTQEIQPRILELYNATGVIDGFTASIDPDLAKYFKTGLPDKRHSLKKSFEGYQNLKKLKEDGIAKDVVAEITVTSENIFYLYDTIKILSDAGIYSSITAIDLKKSDYYDFSTVTNKNLLLEKNQKVVEQFDKIKENKSLLVHIPELLIKLYEILPCEMKCSIYEDIHNVTIDSDGTFRLCLRIRGIYTPELKLNNIITMDGAIEPFLQSAMKKDYLDCCLGCNHTCMLMSKFFSEGIINH